MIYSVLTLSPWSRLCIGKISCLFLKVLRETAQGYVIDPDRTVTVRSKARWQSTQDMTLQRQQRNNKEQGHFNNLILRMPAC